MKRQLLTYYAIAIALVLAWTFLLFVPAMNESTLLKQEVLTAEQTVVQLSREVAELPGILETKVILTETEARQRLHLFTSKQILGLLEKIGRKCDSYDLDIKEVRPPVEELILLHRTNHNTSEPQFLNITLALEGSYAKFGQFVTQLERGPYFRGVNYARLQSATASGSPSQFLIEFKVLLGRGPEDHG